MTPALPPSRIAVEEPLEGKKKKTSGRSLGACHHLMIQLLQLFPELLVVSFCVQVKVLAWIFKPMNCLQFIVKTERHFFFLPSELVNRRYLSYLSNKRSFALRLYLDFELTFLGCHVYSIHTKLLYSYGSDLSSLSFVFSLFFFVK